MIKDKNKEVYTSPITEALELNLEGTILDASTNESFTEPETWSGSTGWN